MTWPTKKLGEVLDYEQPTKYLVSSIGYKDEFLTPVLTAGKTFILGNTNEKKGIFPKEKLPVIIFDDFTTATKFVDFPFKVKSSAMKILHAKKGIADAKYLFYLIQTIKFSHKQHKRYWISEYSQLEIPLPSIEEQKRIVEKIEKLFVKIDEMQKLRKEALDATKALQVSILHEVFDMTAGDTRERESKWRAWEWPVRSLGGVVIINPSKSEIKELSDSIEVSFVPMAAVSEESQSIRDKSIKKLGQVRKGYTYFKNHDVLFAKITPSMENGKIAIAEKLKNGIGFGTTEFYVIRPTKNILSEWIKYFLWRPSFRDEAERHMTGTAGQQRVPVEFLKKSKIPLPPITEQKRVIAYLDSVFQKSNELQNIQCETVTDFFALRQSILASAFIQ